jgi:hypothetical protein
MPGIEHATIAHTPPLAWAADTHWALPGRDRPPDPWIKVNLVGPGYFETTGMRLIRGRTIQDTDRGGSEAEFVAVVNHSMANLLADDGNPIGLCPTVGFQRRCTRIVGVVDMQHESYLRKTNQPMIFRARAQLPDSIRFGDPILLARTTGDPASHVTTIRAALQGLRVDMPYIKVEPMSERLRPELVRFRLGAMLFSLFGGLAVLLAGVGLSGLLGYFVAERTAEIGVRRALGAPAKAVVRLVVRQSLVPVTIGLAFGLAVAFVGSRYLGSLLFGVDARDPLSFAAAGVFLFLTAVLATLPPAWRAARIDPIIALRQE